MPAVPSPVRGRPASNGNQKKPHTISLNDGALEKMKRLAEADGRTLSNFVEWLIKRQPEGRV